MTYTCIHCGNQIPREEIDDSKPIAGGCCECDSCLQQIEFFQEELDMAVKENHLENSFREFNIMFAVIDKLIEEGKINRSEKDIEDAIELLFKTNPSLRSHYRKIENLIMRNAIKDYKQSKLPV